MQYIGKVRIKTNGQVLDSKPGATIDLGGIQRDEVINDNSMGFSETNKPSRIECEIALSKGRSVNEIRDFKDGTAVFECDTGQSYIVKDAYCGPTLSLSVSGIKVAIIGKPAEEMVS